MNNNSKSIFPTIYFLTFNSRAPLDYFQFKTFVKFLSKCNISVLAFFAKGVIGQIQKIPT